MKKTNNIFHLWLLAALVCGLSLSVTSCKDDDDKLSEEEKEQQELERLEQQNNAYSVLSLLADVSAADDDFLSKTYEPTIGKEDDRDANTRIVNTNTMEAAAERFANLADASIDENTQTYTWRDDNLGTMTYTRTNDGSSWATVDVDIKQVPHLQKIVYRSPEQANDNSKFDGRAYYRFGDVVSREVTNKDGSTVTEYWICVRPAFGPEGKEDSHWACLNVLPQANIYEYSKDGMTWRLPTKLGTDKENMQNFAEMLYAILYPEEWEANATSGTRGLKIFYDFKAANLKYHNQYFWKNVNKAWDANDIWTLALNSPKQTLKTYLTPNNFGISMLYKGYSWMTGWNCTLYTANYENGTGKELNMHKATFIDIKRDMRNFEQGLDFTMTGYNIPNSKYPVFFNQSEVYSAWAFRVLKGKQLSSTGKCDKYTNIPGTKEVYRYYHDVLPTTELLTDPEITEAPVSYPPIDEPMVGCLIGADGKFYIDKESAEDNGTEPIAIVCALNGKKRVEKDEAWNGLAMALEPTKLVKWVAFDRSWAKLHEPCTTPAVNSIAEMSGPLNGIAATEKLYGCVVDHVHNHPAATECYRLSTKLNYEAMATGNFSDWFLPSSGQWVLAYKGFGYDWTGQGYDMTSETPKMRSIFLAAGVDVPDMFSSLGDRNYYWTTTQNNECSVLMFSFYNCFSSDFTKPCYDTLVDADLVFGMAKAIPFMAFKYNGGATED